MGRTVSAERFPSSEVSCALAAANERLRRGQTHESRGELPAAVACYDQTVTLLAGLSRTPESQRAQAIACMNRGNALQKQSTRLALNHAIAAYDRAISLLAPLVADRPADHALHNSLGAAHLNRASALLAFDAPTAALDAADRAIGVLASLPLEENIFYRANLAGAYLNRANALLATDLGAARLSARAALDQIADAAPNHVAATHANLCARRTLLSILGRELALAGRDATPARDTARLLNEASDLIDDGLALVRVWEARHSEAFRPAAAQLFHAGAILYASLQPHFLPEFLEENQRLTSTLPAVVQDMLTRARRAAQDRCRLAGSMEPLSRAVATLADLSAFADRLATLGFASPLSA